MLRLMEGGNTPAAPKFIKGEATNTRLMGVFGVHLCWKSRPGNTSRTHWFFRFNIGELGLDEIFVCEGSDRKMLRDMEKRTFGGLGGDLVPLSEREARRLVCYFIDRTKELGEELPPGTTDLDFILSNPPVFSKEENIALEKKLCVPLQTDFAVAHYFLMNIFQRDFEGAGLLCKDGLSSLNIDGAAFPECAVCLRNSLTDGAPKENGSEYLSESLVEANDGHYLVFTNIEVEDKLVKRADFKTKFKVSPTEVALKMKHEEHVALYAVCVDQDFFDAEFSAFSLSATVTSHENGNMAMEFKKCNAHVEQRVFYLFNDLKALYFVSDCGELITAAVTKTDLRAAMEHISSSPISKFLYLKGKYSFSCSVLYDFAQSDYDKFSDFIDFEVNKKGYE